MANRKLISNEPGRDPRRRSTASKFLAELDKDEAILNKCGREVLTRLEFDLYTDRASPYYDIGDFVLAMKVGETRSRKGAVDFDKLYYVVKKLEWNLKQAGE